MLDISQLREVLSTVTETSCPGKLNFHTHTTYSDGRMNPIDLIQQAVILGLEHIAITDHHEIAGFLRAERQLTRMQDTSLLPKLWSGVEINARLLNIEVHILGLGFDHEAESMAPYLLGKPPAGDYYKAQAIIEAIQKADGFAILAHPGRYRKSYESLITAAAALGIDGIETYYDYGNKKPWAPTPDKAIAIKALGDKLGLMHTCGTDSHGYSITKKLF